MENFTFYSPTYFAFGKGAMIGFVTDWRLLYE